MAKKIYGLNEKGEQIELDFKRFLMITDNDSNLEIDLDVKHPEEPDLTLYINLGTAGTKKDQNCGEKIEPGEDYRYFGVIPGASNVLHVKAIRRKRSKS